MATFCWLGLLLLAAHLPAATCRCTLLHDEDPTTIDWEGESYTTFGVAHGDWSTARLTSAIIETLLEERFKLTVSDYTYTASVDVIRQVLGCTDENGELWNATTHPTQSACTDHSYYQDPPLLAWAGVDVWLSGSTVQSLGLQLTYRGKMGYTTTRGLFTHNASIVAGQEIDIFLSWYEFYTLPAAFEMFTSVAALDRAFRNLTVEIFKEDLCPDGNCHGILTPGCINGKSDIDAYLAALGKNEVCTDGWWLAPACRSAPETCIPLLVADGSWHFTSFAQDIASNGMPLALTWFDRGWKGEQEAVRQLTDERFVFYAWSPDDALTSVDPQQVVFDERAVASTQVLLPELIMWEGLAEANERVFTFLRLATFSMTDIETLLDGFAEGKSSDEVACEWILANQAVWKSWIPDLPNATITYVSTERSDAMTAILGAICGAGGLILCCVIPCVIHKSLREITNSPDHENSTTGAWFVKWAGRQRLSLLREVNGSNHARRSRSRSFLVNATPFKIDVVIPHTWRGEMCSGDFTRASGLKKYPHEPISVTIKSYDFPSEYYSVISEHDWRILQKCEALVFSESDFVDESETGASGLTKRIKYVNRCSRKALPCVGKDRMPLGHLKLVRGPNMSLLILWSPPHVLRGIPIRQLETFMTKVINHEKVWEGCWDIDENGEFVQSAKPPGSGSRNMYDACQNIVIPEAAAMDASYSEIFADHGPPAIFLSHAWGEEAQNTKSALVKLREFILSKQLLRTNMDFRGRLPWDEESEGSVKVENALFRVFFCITCNNQSRLGQERGDAVLTAPFARVLKSNFCCQVALLSPLKALHRKWCNYEYCFARRLGKPVFVLTPEGLVEEGQVPPKIMRDLAMTVTTFNCRNAKCGNESDDEFINTAVEEMGGYEAQNEVLKEMFHTAIKHAHGLMEGALHTVKAAKGSGEDGRPSLAELRVFKSKDNINACSGTGDSSQQDPAEQQDTSGTATNTTVITEPRRPSEISNEFLTAETDLITI